MAVLKTGGTAVDAVEAAIKNLEDDEVTNAGYGSNLTLQGTVECDATIVDHLGRCGAVGAVEHIKNPISLARVVLDHSIRPLSLNRVPPNFLAGTGAAEFAYEHGLPIMPSDFLVAPASKARFDKWSQDLKEADAAEKEAAAQDTAAESNHPTSLRNHSQWAGRPPPAIDPQPLAYHTPGVYVDHSGHVRNYTPSSHSNAQGVKVPCQKQPSDIHFITDGGHPTGGDGARSAKACSCLDSVHRPKPVTCKSKDGADITPKADGDNDNQPVAKLSEANLSFFTSNSDQGCIDDSFRWPYLLDGAANDGCDCSKHGPPASKPSLSADFTKSKHEHNRKSTSKLAPRPDDITDTVGAIAVDIYGNVAAGSSSGGIGMKHPGRVGPAALVGIGTSIIPVDPEDEDRKCVAVAVSGTGEHMSTTMIAKTCGERIYDGVKKVRGPPGMLWTVEQCTEDEALASVIQDEFMDHPGVRENGCPAAIGMMCVKVTKNGIGFYFGHNTDSFAIASMKSSDRAPQVLLSRTDGDKAKVAQGGRLISFRHKSTRRGKAAETMASNPMPSSKKNAAAMHGRAQYSK
ncbi:hypothetical protein KEM54_002328 [Ascosphaera aggregata]|nr:hypothetical protein KEM54_002328 [Ascosphaera aggregata]